MRLIATDDANADLPPVVRARITRLQDNSERLIGWIQLAIIVTDMALLYCLIWSFHLQYMQPASFYLKAPTQQYVYIFIALRALRFEVQYVVLAGAAAALGWVVMIGYVLFADPHNAMITRNYVEYLTSNSILVGAEIDKIITIAAVTTILAFAIHAARRMMTQAAREGFAQEN